MKSEMSKVKDTEIYFSLHFIPNRDEFRQNPSE